MGGPNGTIVSGLVVSVSSTLLSQRVTGETVSARHLDSSICVDEMHYCQACEDYSRSRRSGDQSVRLHLVLQTLFYLDSFFYPRQVHCRCSLRFLYITDDLFTVTRSLSYSPFERNGVSGAIAASVDDPVGLNFFPRQYETVWTSFFFGLKGNLTTKPGLFLI
jgi:hypothetical protein